MSEIEALKEVGHYQSLLSYYDTSSGVNPIICKLPYGLQEKWTTKAMNYKQTFRVPYPPFSFFAKFIRDLAKMKNDPSFFYESQPQGKPSAASSNAEKSVSKRNSQQVKVEKTEIKPPNLPNNQDKNVTVPYVS